MNLNHSTVPFLVAFSAFAVAFPGVALAPLKKADLGQFYPCGNATNRDFSSRGDLFSADPALAYGGPGSVISGVGAFLAAAAALLAALFGFLWYPLKRLYKKVTVEEESTKETAASRASE